MKRNPWTVDFCKSVSHHNDVTMSAMASPITSLTTVYSAVYSGTDQGKHQSSASLAFVRGIHRWSVNSSHNGHVTRKMFPFDDVIIDYWTLMTNNKPHKSSKCKFDHEDPFSHWGPDQFYRRNVQIDFLGNSYYCNTNFTAIFPMATLSTCQRWFRWWLNAIQRQSIFVTNDSLICWHILHSLSLDASDQWWSIIRLIEIDKQITNILDWIIESPLFRVRFLSQSPNVLSNCLSQDRSETVLKSHALSVFCLSKTEDRSPNSSSHININKIFDFLKTPMFL